MTEQERDPIPPERVAWEGSEVPPPGVAKEAGWEREALTKLAGAALDEQRRARRWGIFFKLLIFSYLFLILYFVRAERTAQAPLIDGKHTAVVELKGVIADDAEANAEDTIQSLRDAFEARNAVGIILKINSPGGSPVEAGRINDAIKRLRAEHPKKPIYAVVTDMCASGGYYVAVATDRIYADKASIVGSIGVRMGGLSTFGFTGVMEKLGVERRMFTAGNDKGMLDPFSPLKPEEVEHIHSLLDTIHRQFITVVKEGRGNRLKENANLFSGLYWTGEQAQQLGLIDGYGDPDYVARVVIKAEKLVDYTHQPPAFQRLIGRFGASVGMGLAEAVGVRQSGIQ